MTAGQLPRMGKQMDNEQENIFIYRSYIQDLEILPGDGDSSGVGSVSWDFMGISVLEAFVLFSVVLFRESVYTCLYIERERGLRM